MKRKKSIFYIIVVSCYLQTNAQISTEEIKLTDSISSLPVSDQSNTPTCWAFGTNSLIESDFIRKNGFAINLSEMFYIRYAYIQKAATYIVSKGKTYFEGGGQFHDVIRVSQEYGMIPEIAYSGKLYNQKNHNHARLDTAMQVLMRKFMLQRPDTLTKKGIQQINDTLDKYLGKVPLTFLFKGKKYTPKSFAKRYFPFINSYIELVSFADKPLYQKFILKDKYNWANDSFFNVTLADLKAITDTALVKGWSVGWEGDVTENGFNYYGGFAYLDSIPKEIDAKRLENYSLESTERDHMLHIVGAGTDTALKRWYYMKNSWGNTNKLHGFMYMNEKYFDYKTVILFVNKEALPLHIKNKIKN